MRNRDTYPAEWTAAEVRALRERCGLTVVQAAHAIGYAPSTWQRWEAGESTPSFQARRVLRNLQRDYEKRGLI